ncbi:MAG: hypothetical protein ACFFCW_24060 [Candidatus Hodarchaeota archaeon]
MGKGKEPEEAKAVINLRGVPRHLYKTLKIRAAIEEITFKDLIIRILREYVEKL